MSAQFYIVAQTPEGEKPVDGYGPYDNGKAAAQMCKELNETTRLRTGFKYEPRRMAAVDPSAWRKREEQRIASGFYRPLPDAWKKLTPVENHFLHISQANMNRVAYFPDDTAGTLDRAVETTAGRYLKANYPHLNEEQVKDYIALIDNMTDVNFAKTREEMAWVYQNGPDSCMSKNVKHYNSKGIHPAEGYAGGDLAIAWLGKKGERVSARAVCCPARKQFGTVYGDRSRLSAALEKIGWKQVGSFAPGIKMAKIPLEKYTFVMPYFDNFGSMVDKGEYFETIATKGGSVDFAKATETVFVTAGNSSGFCSQSKYCPKNRNLQGMDSEWRFVEGVNEEWSNSAWRSYAFECPGVKKLYPDDAKYYSIVRTGRYDQQKFSTIYAKDNTFMCAELKVLCLNKDLDPKASTDDKKVSTFAAEDRKAREAAAAKKKAEDEAREAARIAAEAKAKAKAEDDAKRAAKIKEEMKRQAKRDYDRINSVEKDAGPFDMIKPEAKTRKRSSGASEQARAATTRVFLSADGSSAPVSYAPVTLNSSEEYEGA